MKSPSTPIETVEQLQEYLYVALQLEHATIPPYLTAAYTALTEANGPSIAAITAIAREEMLHLTLAANLLNAVGGKPNLLREGFVPSYPCYLPDGETDFEVSIESFSKPALNTFLKIERPCPPKGSEEDTAPVQQHGDIKYIRQRDLRPDTRGKGRGMIPPVTIENSQGQTIELHYWSIGEFYNAIGAGFKYLAANLGPDNLFTGDTKRQVDPNSCFDIGGAVTHIVDLKTALSALQLISVQGEGYTDEVHGMSGELAHYYRFEQILIGNYYEKGDLPHCPTGGPFPRNYAAVYPIKKNAKIADYSMYPDIERHARLFNGLYRRFLEKLNRAFNGEPDLFANSSEGKPNAYRDMRRIQEEMVRLIKNPLSDTGENAAPTFEMSHFIYPPEEI